ncbi:MAG: hypothetical protein N4A54_07245 [Peptostreptococcaceae bacterium]|jgi:hypothetical protein|nr:hypothetical protein [Peptostreptococcaceae bacterium]
MKHIVKKITKIADEIMTFLLINDSDELDFKIKKENDRYIVKIVSYNTKFSDDDVLELDEILNVQRQHEVEAYYWQLAGETDFDNELLLIGSMVDEAKVYKANNNLYIEFFRIND